MLLSRHFFVFFFSTTKYVIDTLHDSICGMVTKLFFSDSVVLNPADMSSKCDKSPALGRHKILKTGNGKKTWLCCEHGFSALRNIKTEVVKKSLKL